MKSVLPIDMGITTRNDNCELSMKATDGIFEGSQSFNCREYPCGFSGNHFSQWNLISLGADGRSNNNMPSDGDSKDEVKELVM